jgi:hypothetical protein
LLKKASEGVRVYVLLYKEVPFVLNLLTQRTRQILTDYGAQPNVKVLRHPDHFFDGVFLWSHHEKFLIVDQTIAFMGGIDLCYGRWDDERHCLVDMGQSNCSNSNVIEIDESKVVKMPPSTAEAHVIYLITNIKRESSGPGIWGIGRSFWGPYKNYPSSQISSS